MRPTSARNFGDSAETATLVRHKARKPFDSVSATFRTALRVGQGNAQSGKRGSSLSLPFNTLRKLNKPFTPITVCYSQIVQHMEAERCTDLEEVSLDAQSLARQTQVDECWHNETAKWISSHC